MYPIPRPVAAVPPFVVRGWSMGGWCGGVGGTGAGEQGQFGAVPPRRYSRVAVGPRKPSFCLKRPQRLMRRLGRALTGQTVQTTRVGAAHSGREGEPDFENSIFISVVFGVSLVPSHGSGSAEPQSWGLLGFGFGFGFDLDFDWDLCSICVGPLRD